MMLGQLSQEIRREFFADEKKISYEIEKNIFLRFQRYSQKLYFQDIQRIFKGIFEAIKINYCDLYMY